ncbi:MAG: hypothetical protein RL660_2468 [Bacteroidota bacterium]|jgi:hypothetical protein
MSTIEIAQPKIIVDKQTSEALKQSVLTESQTIVHVKFVADNYGSLIRIWASTFLCPHESNQRSKLLHNHNITLYPYWTEVLPNETYYFTLVFEALPKNCIMFDLIEDIPQSGGFEIRSIVRNNSDVYSVELVG